MNWQEIKLAALKKIDPAVTSLTPTRNTRDYLNAIIPAANRGLNDLSSVGKFLIRAYNVQIPDLQGAFTILETRQHLNEDIILESEGARAFSFEITGPANVKIYTGETLALEKEIKAESDFQTVKGKIPAGEEKNVKIVFSGAFPYQFRNIALYSIEFESDETVWECGKNRRFDLKKLTPDFYKLVSTDVVREKDCEKFHDYRWEGDSTLVLAAGKPGNYRVHYYAYPREITEATPNDYELELDQEVAAILPIFIAAELLEDDDSSLAYYVREQYEEAKAKLQPSMPLGRPSFIDRWGWS